MSKQALSARVLPAVLSTIACTLFSSATLGADNPATQEVKIQGDQIITIRLSHSRTGLEPTEALQLSRNVSFADLDLATPVGADALEKRIAATASSICQRLMNTSPWGSAHDSLQERASCVYNAVAGARPKAQQAIASAKGAKQLG
jgi:UrcA family protein